MPATAASKANISKLTCAKSFTRDVSPARPAALSSATDISKSLAGDTVIVTLKAPQHLREVT
jgi:hypothetical protein